MLSDWKNFRFNGLFYRSGYVLMPTNVKKLIKIFNELKLILKGFEGPFKPKFDLDSKYDLWSFKDVEIAGRKRKEVSFVSIIIQSSYVGLYYMPIYTDIKLQDVFKPELLKLLKGKTCFHIQELNAELKTQIHEALEIGYALYQKRGWV